MLVKRDVVDIEPKVFAELSRRHHEHVVAATPDNLPVVSAGNNAAIRSVAWMLSTIAVDHEAGASESGCS